MAAPNLTLRNVVFVNYVGTDDAGYNPVGRPWSKLTIAAALADLAANYPPPSATNPTGVAVGPGVFTTAGFEIPPWVWIFSSDDGQTSGNTTLLMTGDITLSADWADGVTQGGLANLSIRNAEAAVTIDMTLPAPLAGNPAREVQFENVTTNCNVVFEASGTNDGLLANRLEHDGIAPQTVLLRGGEITLHECAIDVGTRIFDTATIPGDARLTGSFFSALTLDESAGAGLTVDADAISLPDIGSLVLVGTPTLTRLTDANGVGYTPAVPASWPAGTDTVQEALDALAAAGVTTSATDAIAFTNNAGNTTITPGAHYYSVQATFTGAARTSVLILSTAAPPIVGDIIDVFVSRVDGGGIVAEMRNATAGGTLLATMPDATGTTTGLFRFVYGTLAEGFAANAWVAHSYQIPATL